MPWHVAKSDQCSEDMPYAVIKDDDGSVEGCHESEEAANEQMAALYASEEESRAVNLKPTAGMASAARRGLRLHEQGKSGDGLKPETVRRANKLANREDMNPAWVREMNAWFARHAVDKKPGWDKPGSETAGFVAHLLWGGDAAKTFAARKVKELESSDRSHPMNIERRDYEFLDGDELVIEERSGGMPVIRGYAVVYNRLSVEFPGGFRERIMPGAFDKVLKRQQGRADLVSYFNHDPNVMLGRESSGTLKVWSDERGVGFEVTPPKTREDIVELIARGDVKGASFTFSLASQGGEAFVKDDSTGRAVREIREANIYELGPVVQPAYPATTAAVAMRSFERWVEQQREAEENPQAAIERHIRNAAPALRAARLRSL